MAPAFNFSRGAFSCAGITAGSNRATLLSDVFGTSAKRAVLWDGDCSQIEEPRLIPFSGNHVSVSAVWCLIAEQY